MIILALVCILFVIALMPVLQVAYKYMYKSPLRDATLEVWVGKDDQGKDLFLYLPPKPDDNSIKRMADTMSKVSKASYKKK